MAATLSPFHHHHLTSHFNPSLKLKSQSFSLTSPKLSHSNLICFSASHSPDPSSPPSPSIESIPYNNIQSSLTSGRFLTNEELKKLEFLNAYTYSCKLPSGQLRIRVMKDLEIDIIVALLAESFAESMFLPNMYLTLLGFLVKQYLIERRSLLPHAVTLIGFYRDDEGDNGVNYGDSDANDGGDLAGTVEVSFDRRGANASPPTPTPPKDCPYICNMTVKKQFRRRGIGWHLLKASEEVISHMASSRDVYLHCRLIDSAPFNMYKKAGYEVVKTDSLLILLTLQRRKHLMCKELPFLSKPLEIVTANDDDEAPSSVNACDTEPLLFEEVGQNSADLSK